jgi:hypothetical protein
MNICLKKHPKMKKAKIRQKTHYIFSKAQTPDYELKRKIFGEKHMENGLKQGVFDVKRELPQEKKSFEGKGGR